MFFRLNCACRHRAPVLQQDADAADRSRTPPQQDADEVPAQSIPNRVAGEEVPAQSISKSTTTTGATGTGDATEDFGTERRMLLDMLKERQEQYDEIAHRLTVEKHQNERLIEALKMALSVVPTGKHKKKPAALLLLNHEGKYDGTRALIRTNAASGKWGSYWSDLVRCADLARGIPGMPQECWL